MLVAEDNTDAAESLRMILEFYGYQVGVAHTGRNRPVSEDREGHEEARRREAEWREIGLGAQILKDLGVQSIDLLASRERHYVGLEGFGIKIVRTEIL